MLCPVSLRGGSASGRLALAFCVLGQGLLCFLLFLGLQVMLAQGSSRRAVGSSPPTLGPKIMPLFTPCPRCPLASFCGCLYTQLRRDLFSMFPAWFYTLYLTEVVQEIGNLEKQS